MHDVGWDHRGLQLGSLNERGRGSVYFYFLWRILDETLTRGVLGNTRRVPRSLSIGIREVLASTRPNASLVEYWGILDECLARQVLVLDVCFTRQVLGNTRRQVLLLVAFSFDEYC